MLLEKKELTKLRKSAEKKLNEKIKSVKAVAKRIY